jgi:hypothetical protein
MLKRFILLLCISFVAIPSFAQEVVLKTEFDRDSIMIGEHVTWTMKATVDKSLKAFFPTIDSINNGRIELLKNNGLDTLKESSKNNTIQNSYVITSFDEGIYVIPPIPLLLGYADGTIDTVYFDQLSLKVKTVPIDTTTFVAFDIKTPIHYPVTFMEVLPWALGGLIVIGLILFLIYIIRRRKQNKPLFFSPKPKEPPHIIAMRELEKIKGEKLWQNNKIKTYYTRITDVLRVYMEERYHMQAMEQTSEEILQALSSMTISEELMNKLRELLSISDLVKFAKYSPMNNDNENVLSIAGEFIEKTKEEENNEEKSTHQ